ncbi:hypothetical protein CH286_04075 [Rhodococcus sp. WWJCD1]|uniref:hypothetical protein n=1 Tax=Rhodococcus sp. WWJCD1 TaxID=2022519 RepID=UPI000B9B24CC|nr:hypothetical protein [Rhodococcus sp. WWJCD1]OZC52035.1 hypothetical protein CH286_04075 [Rhodococcus sp. WWJCD1]
MTNPQPPITVIGTAVILTGSGVEVALRAAINTQRARRTNGLPVSGDLNALVQACMSVRGHADVRDNADPATSLEERPTIPIEEAATMLGLSNRQTRRLAPKLGGKLIAGRWLLDMQAIIEHAFTPSGHPVTVPALNSPLPATDLA